MRQMMSEGKACERRKSRRSVKRRGKQNEHARRDFRSELLGGFAKE